MSKATLESRYLSWLTDQVADIKKEARGHTHRKLFKQLHETIFVAVIPFDENRVADARDLRYEYLSSTEIEAGDPDWTRSPASMLELLIVLSRLLAFEMDDPVKPWFWHLVDVLELERFNDHIYNNRAEEEVAEILDRVIWRTYEPDGRGGLFPLRSPRQDQREVELWYQLNAYLLEQF